MSYGLSLAGPGGVPTFNSGRFGGLFLDFVSMPNGTSGQRTYPAFAGRTLVVMPIFNSTLNRTDAYFKWSISYAFGIPTFTWDMTSFGTNVFSYHVLNRPGFRGGRLV